MSIQVNKIKSAIIEFQNGSNVSVTRYLNLPMTWETTLDETHGTAKILLTEMRQTDFESYGVKIDGPLNVNTPLEISFEGQETVIRMIVARDTAEMIRKDGWETWSHTLELVDEVKKLEQEPVDNLTFKNPVFREYESSGNVYWTIVSDDVNNNKYTPPKISQLVELGVLAISFNSDSFAKDSADWGLEVARLIKSLTATIVKPSGATMNYDYELSPTFNVNIDEEGEYLIRIELTWYKKWVVQTIQTYTVVYEGYFSTIGTSRFSPYTIKDVIDRVLSVTPLRTKNAKNKYRFQHDAEDYSTEEAPEFTFTGKHLFEVMLDIASYKKMFPALYKDEIYFRPFWNGVELYSEDLPPCIKAIQCSAIDQYCTSIDSYVENMVCVNDTNVGTVIEPYDAGYISTRSNSGSEISETTAIIPTQSNIYKSLKLYLDDVNDENIGNIHSYVYEQDEYDALSDTSASYPYSKAYALKFTRFEKNYTELAHRIVSVNNIAAALKKPALANIVATHEGGSVGETLRTWLSEYIGGDGQDGVTRFADLCFQPHYIPIVNARVRQYKPIYNENDYDATLYYNQQSELVDSEAFGEHVKGVVQKLGNHTEIRVYRFERVDEVPTVGTLIDEKSVYNVSMTIYENHVDVTICLVDYAELSTFIGVKNEVKTSDISISKWSKRYVHWEEFLLFTQDEISGDAISITTEALNDIVLFNNTYKALTCAMFANYTEGGSLISEAFAPIKHLAIGDSIFFQWEMLDNFAVGYKSEEAPSGATNAKTGTLYNRAQKAVRYGDVYGRMETMDFYLLGRGPNSANSEFKKPNVTSSINGTTLTVTLSAASDLYWICYVYISAPNAADSFVSYTFEPGETSFSRTVSEGSSISGITIQKPSGTDECYHKNSFKFCKKLAHSYPAKPNDLVFTPSENQKDNAARPRFRVYDLLVKKNSSEALTFSAQYHFRQTWKEFIIGSGMSNFCALVGGSCSQLHFFISAKPINRFERHIDLDDTDNYYIVDELPTFIVESDFKRVKIYLPSIINKYSSTKSWGLVGVDRNGNYQLIFGENRKSNDNPFHCTIYLVAKRKNNEPAQKATFTLSIDQESSHDTSVLHSIFVDNELVDIAEENEIEIPHGAIVTIRNDMGTSIWLRVDGLSRTVAYKSSYSFTIRKDTKYAVWKTSGSSGGILV